MAGDSDSCWPSLKTISLAVKCSRSVVINAIKELKAAGLVETTPSFDDQRNQRSNVYTLFNPKGGSAVGDHPVRQANGRGLVGDHRGVGGKHKEETSEEELLKKYTNCNALASNSSRREIAVAGFDRLWKKIPKRISKGRNIVEAWEMWKGLTPTPTKQHVAEIVRILEAYLREVPKANGFFDSDGIVKMTPARLIDLLCRAMAERRSLGDVLEDVMLEDLDAEVQQVSA